MKDFFESLKKRYHYAMVVFKELVKTTSSCGIRLIPGHGVVRAETVDAVRRDVRGVREVPEVLGWHSDLPDFIAVRHLPVELLLGIDQHGHAVHRRTW